MHEISAAVGRQASVCRMDCPHSCCLILSQVSRSGAYAELLTHRTLNSMFVVHLRLEQCAEPLSRLDHLAASAFLFCFAQAVGLPR